MTQYPTSNQERELLALRHFYPENPPDMLRTGTPTELFQKERVHTRVYAHEMTADDFLAVTEFARKVEAPKVYVLGTVVDFIGYHLQFGEDEKGTYVQW